MTLSNSEISFYVDTMIVETLLADSHLAKFGQDGIVSTIVSKVKDYFAGHFNSEDKTGSVINMLAPGALYVGLSAMGIGWIGPLLAFAMSVFNIDSKKILGDIWTSIKSVIGSGSKTSSTQVDSIVDSALANHAPPATEEEASKAEQTLKTQTSLQLLRDAKLLKFALIAYDQSPESFVKEAKLFDWFSSKKGASASLLGIIFKWVFKIILASAGFMVAGDVANKVLGRPNALDGSLQGGKPAEEASVAAPKVISKQTKFPVNPGYQDVAHTGESWIENIQNNEASISNMLLSWAKQVYKGLGGLDAVIENTAGFQAAVDAISWQNRNAPGGPIVFIPRMFTSKKMVVDHFIDDVAEKAPK